MRWSTAIWWLALLAAAAAAAIAANVVLLDVAESQDDPVGRLNPRVLVQSVDEQTSPATTGDTQLPATSTAPAETAATTGDDDSSGPQSNDPDKDDHGGSRGEDDDD